MYTPSAFAFDATRRVGEFLSSHGLGIVTLADRGEVEAVHVPLVQVPGPTPLGTLLGHVAQANPVRRCFDGRESLVVLSGPDAYVSPDWYESEGLVPTWNYVVIHLRGRIRHVGDRSELKHIVERLSAIHEARLAPKPVWTIGKLSSESLDVMLRGIVGFAIDVERVEGKAKLSQNRNSRDREAVARALAERDDAKSRQISAAMTRSSTDGQLESIQDAAVRVADLAEDVSRHVPSRK